MDKIRKRNEPPASQEAMRQRIMLALHKIEKETNLFNNKFLEETENTKNWTDMANFICEASGRKLNKIEDNKEFKALMKATSGVKEVFDSLYTKDIIKKKTNFKRNNQ